MVNKVGIYLIRDVVAEDDGPLFEAVNDEVAKRSFYNLIKQNNINPNEYQLIRLGYVTKNGQYELSTSFEVIQVAHVMRGENNNFRFDAELVEDLKKIDKITETNKENPYVKE